MAIQDDLANALLGLLVMFEARPDVRALFGITEGHLIDTAMNALDRYKAESPGEQSHKGSMRRSAPPQPRASP